MIKAEANVIGTIKRSANIRTDKNKAFTPVFGNKAERPTVSNQENQSTQEQTKPQVQHEEVAARSTEQPRFHR